MDTPSSFPTWRFYADGRTAIVESPAELAALPPGHAGSPAGPFPSAEEPAPVPEPEPDEDEEDGVPDDLDPEEGSETDVFRLQARALREEGVSITQIARTMGRSRTTVRRWLET